MARPVPRFYRYIMAFIFAIDEIKRNLDILPNMTLGYHVYDSCNNVNKAIDSVLQILSGPGDLIPNFLCTKFMKLVGVIGDLHADISLNVAQILGIFGYSQISYGAVDPILSNVKFFPSFFQALSNYSTQLQANVQVLRHYNWMWIGVITSDDDVGEKQSYELKTMATKYDICVEYIIKIHDEEGNHLINKANTRILNISTSQIVVICGKFSLPILYFLKVEINEAHEKTLIVPIPVSICSDQCPPGYKRTLKPGIHKCCFDCLKCSEGEISSGAGKQVKASLPPPPSFPARARIPTGVHNRCNEKMSPAPGKRNPKVNMNRRGGLGLMGTEANSVSCHKCSEDQWPNDLNVCVPKPIECFTYKKDTSVLIISLASVLFFIITSTILGIFILFRDTPVVRANKQTLSFILLVSIMLTFLCVFLFLGRPTHVTCMLRQTSFGIIFSVVISSILAKTIMVYMAFKATKPGSSWRKFIGVKVTNCVVFCSFLQMLLSIIWLSTSPPFPEQNTQLYQDKIIFQCNEGSMLAFSILLGYMGLLAAVSFIVAFLARNLPDSFNEAKNITFSMLVVCSVWVAFIPAYMSVTGKNTVLVEIFAIISSSVGILGCIFFPKCYIILVRPDLNTKSSVGRQRKATF
ncbi:vomeronasal type-2 receptor 26-like [Dendropsophus ebraccatus]|uniref:vomeronasal type-2 receptor 26-like n=1 Tax=Dendropsophus ebraccatus TaxID=150705 RepID=UPI003832086A